MMEMGIFTALSVFLKPLHYLCDAQLCFAAHQKYISIYILVFLIVVDDYQNLGFVFPPIYISIFLYVMSG